MKKKYRRSQISKILGHPLFGFDMHKYGLPYLNAGGSFCEKTNENSVDLLLAAVQCHFPKIHAVSLMPNGIIYNRYIDGATLYRLFTGNHDPELEFSNEYSIDDFSEEEQIEMAMHHESHEMTLEDENAIRWQLKQLKSGSKK